MQRLNYHHLHYFWAVAKQGNLTRAAEQLHVSQSALSTQIRQLEDELGQDLFERRGRLLELTEAGRIALDYADQIFSRGEELLATLRSGRDSQRQVLRIGAQATLSRNFQQGFLQPLLQRDDIHLVLHSAGLDELLQRLATHSLDLVLSNRPVRSEPERSWRCQRIARQQVSLIGQAGPRAATFRFPEDMEGLVFILPSPDSEVRVSFDLLCAGLDLHYKVLAEVDDMAMLRLLARSARAAAVVPRVVVRDELRSGQLTEYCTLPGVYEDFYAIGIRRQYQHPLLRELLKRSAPEVLESE
ncbi:LysR family transcriptional regulator [bacterium]|nr:LysR family transcriptional regulator [bacterium]